MSDLRSRLLAQISSRAPSMLRDLAAHVAIPTGHNHTPGLDQYRGVIVDRLAALGASRELIPGEPRPSWIDADPGSGNSEKSASNKGMIPPTVVCRSEEVQAAPSGAPRGVAANARILISGHLDTVFAPSDPFNSLTLAPDGKTAVGPGVVDMKGGILIAVNAIEALASCGLKPAWTFILDSDEETGSFHSTRALRAEAAKHDVGIALEPALPGGGLAIERKGSGQFMVEVRGRSAHAGRDFEKGVSAVYALARTLTKIEALSDLTKGTTVNVGPITGGVAANIVPDRAVGWGNVRFADKATADELGRRLDALATVQDAMPRIIIHHTMNRPAKPKIAATESLALLAREVAESLGQQLPFASTGGVCDGNTLQAAGLPTIDSMGVRGGGLHTHQEWIEVPSLVERCQLLALLFARLSGHTV